jgi:hypothetical protein
MQSDRSLLRREKVKTPHWKGWRREIQATGGGMAKCIYATFLAGLRG